MIRILKNNILMYLLLLPFTLFLSSCSQIVIGGASTSGLIFVQERSPKQAALDILIKTKIEEAMFSNDYDNLFSKVRVIVYEGKVLLVGTVEKESLKEKAESISWDTKDVKEVANYISIGKNDLIDYVRDTRISLEFRAKLLTDREISEVNFSITTENRVLYVVGIAQNDNEMEKVIQHASNIAGVRKIVNLVRLKDIQ